MRKRIKFFWFVNAVLLLIGSFGVGSVLAMVPYQATSTNTLWPTPTLPFSQVTPTIPVNLTCPVGTPYGYGTITPNPLWELICVDCLPTGTAYPTWTIPPEVQTAFAQTATSTSTPITPTATNTPIPAYCGGTVTCNGGANGGVCTQIDPYTVKFTGSSTNYPMEIHLLNNAGITMYWSMFWELSGGYRGFIGDLTDNCGSVGRSVTIKGHLDTPIKTLDILNTYDYGSWSRRWYRVFGEFESHYVEPNVTQNMYAKASWSDCALYQAYSWATSYALISSCSAGQYTTPTPSPTPPSTYCSVVDDWTDDSQAFSWSGMTFGDSACVSTPEVDMEFLTFSFTIPEIKLCMQEVSFGVITVFALALSLDVFLIVLVAAWALNYFFIT